jgi:hypothetical protein
MQNFYDSMVLLHAGGDAEKARHYLIFYGRECIWLVVT